jgi:hypothetical protein
MQVYIDAVLTAILFKNTLVQCLLDSGTEKFMVREKTAKCATCKVKPRITIMCRLDGGLIDALGNTKVSIQSENGAVKLEFLMVPDSRSYR